MERVRPVQAIPNQQMIARSASRLAVDPRKNWKLMAIVLTARSIQDHLRISIVLQNHAQIVKLLTLMALVRNAKTLPSHQETKRPALLIFANKIK